MVHNALVNKIIMDSGISEINPDHNKGKKESPQIRLLPEQAYRIISMDETRILEDQIKDKYESKGVCAKGEGGRSNNKYEKGVKGGVSFSAAE